MWEMSGREQPLLVPELPWVWGGSSQPGRRRQERDEVLLCHCEEKNVIVRKGKPKGIGSVSVCAALTLPARYSVDVWALTLASRYTQLLLRETQLLEHHGQGLPNTASRWA